MKMTLRLGILAGLAAALHAGYAADITGKILLKGTPPPERPLPLDPQCGKTNPNKPTTRFFVTGDGGTLGDVFVYLKSGLEGKTFSPPAQPAVMDQVGCEYIPYVMGLQTKQKLVVKNSDPLLHNVHITPSPGSMNKESNQAQIAKGPDIVKTFDHPEVFLRFKCDVHNWMFAYVGILDHSFYAVTGKDGSFTIKNVPPGKYTLAVVHRKCADQTKEITVASDNVKADFTLDIKP